jgi:hypothetical protein
VLHAEQQYPWPIIPCRPASGATKMNLPKQSRPVTRDVSRDPLKAQVQGSPCPCNLINKLDPGSYERYVQCCNVLKCCW